ARRGQGVEQAGRARRDRLDPGVGDDLRFLRRFRFRRLHGRRHRCRLLDGLGCIRHLHRLLDRRGGVRSLRGFGVEVELRLAALGEGDVAGHGVVLLVRGGLCVLVAGLGIGPTIAATTATTAATAATTAAAALGIALVTGFRAVVVVRLFGNGRGDRSGGFGGRRGADCHCRGGSFDHRGRDSDVLDFRLRLGDRLGLGRGLLLPGLARLTRLARRTRLLRLLRRLGLLRLLLPGLLLLLLLLVLLLAAALRAIAV